MPAAGEEFVGVLDYAKSRGLDLSGFKDDQEAIEQLLNLYQRYPQVEQLARYGNEFLQHQEAFTKYLATQASPGQLPPNQPQPAKKWWTPPASREEVQQLIKRWYVQDPATGEVKPRPEAPPSAVQKVADYSTFISNWQEKVQHDPENAFAGLIKEQAKTVVQDLLQERQVQDAAMSVVNRHAVWMFYADPRTGVPLYGNYTPQGAAFWNHVQQAERKGIHDVHNQEDYALRMLQLDQYQQWYAQQQTALQPPAGRTPATTPQLPSPANRQPSYTPPSGQPAPLGAVNLAQLFRQNLAANGIDRFSLEEI